MISTRFTSKRQFLGAFFWVNVRMSVENLAKRSPKDCAGTRMTPSSLPLTSKPFHAEVDIHSNKFQSVAVKAHMDTRKIGALGLEEIAF